MTRGGRRTSIAVFIVLGAALAAGAAALNVGWIIVSWQNVGLLVAGLLVFPLVIAGVVINTIFLVREIRRNDQHEAFINAMTHELKTPLASMRLYLQTLQNRQVDEARRQEFYGVMLEDSERLLGTIDQVLRAGQLGARRKQRGGHTAVDLNALVSAYVSLARTRHHLEPDALTYRPPGADGPHVVLGDEDELEAVVSNLVDNAVKYSGSQVRVEVELEHIDDATIALRVRDHGIGIPLPEQKRIFKRFYRIPGARGRRINGTGLGLFIVRSVVKRHGGQVYAESGGPGLGSTFVVQLPLASP